MKKHAIIIIAHNNLDILNKLLELLDSKYFDIFLHIDLKSDINASDIYMCKKSLLFFYKLMDIKWADYSMIEAELFMFEEASKNNYEYYHIISGVDLPIKSNKEIYDIFHNNYPKEFVHFVNSKEMEYKIDWIKYYHDVNDAKANPSFYFVDQINIEKQKNVGIDRIKNDKNIFKSGANWVSITHELVKYLLSKKEYIEERFSHSISGDELFVQTLVYNSKFKDNLYCKEESNYDACLREIDWERGSPYVWMESDFDFLKSSNKAFARKFDPNVDSNIIKKIFEYVKELNNKDDNQD